MRQQIDEILNYRRKDQQIKVRGFRIEPGEGVAVSPKCCRPRRSRAKNAVKRLLAHIVLRQTHEGERVDDSNQSVPTKFCAHLAERLPDHMIPTMFCAITAIPLTDNGKIDRLAVCRTQTPVNRDRDCEARP